MTLEILYVDTLFFINFALDLLSLCLTGVFLHMERRLLRLLIASFLGAVYAVLAVILAIHPALHVVLSLLCAFVLLSVSYRSFGSPWRYLGAVAVFYLASMLLGGAIEALFSFLETLLHSRTDAHLRPADLVLLFGFLAFLAVWGLRRLFGGISERSFATVRATLDGKSVSFPVLVDSGCLLSDPISGKPALLVRLEALSDVLPSQIVACARSRTAYMPRDPAYARRCRLIPAEALGERRIFLSVRMDELSLLPAKGSRERARRIDAYIALFPVERHHFGGFEGLLPSSLS